MTKEDYIGEEGLLHCGTCGEAKEAYIPKNNIWGKDRRSRNCRCEREDQDKEMKQRLGEEHMQKVKEFRRNCFRYSNYADATFQNSKVVNKQSVFCQEYVKDWEQMKAKNIGMLFWGDVGTGKTYLAACVANALIEQEVSVRMLNFSHILNSGFETRNEVLEDICRCSLLIIDDFGSERETEYGLETMHSVLDARYSCGKPMIVTTNLPLQAIRNPADIMHKKIYDRLENCVPIQFTGESRRKVIGTRKMEEFRQVLMNAQDSF